MDSMEVSFSNEEPVSNSVLVQNYVIKHLEDGNIQLLFCSPEEANERSYQTVNDTAELNSEEASQANGVIEFDLDIDANSGNEKSSTRLLDLPVISIQKNSVTPSSLLSETNGTSHVKSSTNPIPIISKPERILLNVTIYSCFKCNEQFKSLTLFRQHLKWHKAEKIFKCMKCSAGFNVENNLKIHMVTNHPVHHTDVCPICKIKFQRKASLKSHIMIHQVEELFTCDECHGEFQNDDELIKHMELHAVTRITKTLSDALICPYCKVDFKTLAEYRQHIEKHTEVKRSIFKGKKVRKKRTKENMGRFKCKYCGKLFSKSCLLERHERIHTGERPYECQYCKRGFAQKGTLQIHLGSHTGIKPYSCTLCQAKFTQKGNLRVHIEKTHTAPKGNQKMYKCTQCPCIFRKIASLNGHITKVHLNQVEKDMENIIDKVMDSLKMLNNELGKSALKKDDDKTSFPSSPSQSSEMGCVKVAESHANGDVRQYIVPQKKIGDVRWYFCNYCASRFKKPSDLIRHFRTHTLEKPYKCTKCNQAFSLKSTLINHYKVHNAPKSVDAKSDVKVTVPDFYCTVCDEVFFSRQAANEHGEAHGEEGGGDRKIIQPILEQPLYETAYGSLSLKPPKPRVSIGKDALPSERPHHCKICDARFTRLMCLKRHMLVHTGERKYKCTLCPKAFITKYGLKEHTNYHKNIRNYGCQTCGKKFVTATLLKRHMIVHNNFKPYSCPHCDKRFKTSLLCRSHIKTVHNSAVFEITEESTTKEVVNSETTARKVPQEEASKKDEKKNINQNDIVVTTSAPAAAEQLGAEQSSAVLSVAPQENQQDSNPAYQMVYVNIGDMPVTNGDLVLNGNSLMSTLKIQNDSFLFNPLGDLQDPPIIFNIDNNKTDMVDPNEVIKSTTSSYGSSSASNKTPANVSSMKQTGEPATRRTNGGGDDLATLPQGITLQSFAGVDLGGGFPISIIETEDTTALTHCLVGDEMNINPGDIFSNAQVICINCHKLFCDMNVFQKHVCCPDSSDNISLVLGENYSVGDSKKNHPISKSASNTKLGTDSTSFLTDDASPPANFVRLKRFTDKKGLRKDLERLEKSREFLCGQCGYSTSIEERYRRHLNLEHAKTADKVCKYCFKEFKKNSDLLRHVRTHTGERPFECEKCLKKFTLKSTLEYHYRTHEIGSALKISCPICNSNFTSKSSLKVHMLLHTGVRPYACTFCDQTFRTSAIRKAHEKNNHLGKNRLIVDKPKVGRKLLKSMAEEVGNQVKVIKTFDIQQSQGILTQNHPPQHSLPIEPILILQQLNGADFILTNDNESTLPLDLNDFAILDYADHKTNENNLNFDVTSFQYADGVQYLQNVDVNVPPPEQIGNTKQAQKVAQKVECDICHKMYASKDVLRKHKRNVHGQNKRFPCIKCDKGYDSLEELNKHIVKLHTGHRPYACQYCANSFSEENSLKTHIKRIHQKSRMGQETSNALLGLQLDLPVLSENTLI